MIFIPSPETPNLNALVASLPEEYRRHRFLAEALALEAEGKPLDKTGYLGRCVVDRLLGFDALERDGADMERLLATARSSWPRYEQVSRT